MKNQCKAIGIIELVLGLVGSIFLAKGSGTDLLTGERNWLVTILVFAVGAAVSYAVYVILSSIAEVLEKQENISKRLEALEASSEKQEQKISSIRNSSVFGDVPDPGLKDSWICPKCGKKNANYVGTCSCGCMRSSVK